MKYNKELQYLMNSEWNNSENAEELKFALIKFKEYYRLSHSKQIRLENSIERCKKDIEKYKRDIEKLEEELEKNKDKYKDLKERKLTFKERLDGKVYENKFKRRFSFFGKYF